jgi:uncharacterized protein (DUF983 family)
MKKGSKLYSIIAMKCPRCHEGDLFRSPLLPRFKLLDMHENCPVCKQSFNLETGFYWGAMYIAYIYSSGALLISAGLCFLVFHLNLSATLLLVTLTAIVGFAPNARLSRSTWINFFVAYDAAEAWKKTHIDTINPLP